MHHHAQAEQARAQAKAADAEISAGSYRGPLHGIPFGVKDLLDTAGIATTYGAEPFRDRVPKHDSVVVRRLQQAGGVLMAKLSLGALALNDIWFGGQTMNPWLLEEGASGSSAGPGAATAAGLVGFSIGSETGGSIVSPSMRCGVTGFRPTFGRVPRTGAMTLCWSLDKLGPMTRGVEDAMLVLQAISGPDAGDVSSVASHLDYDANGAGRRTARRCVPGVDAGGTGNRCRSCGARLAAHTRARTGGAGIARHSAQRADAHSVQRGRRRIRGADALGQGGEMKVQVPDAWPNLFRMSRFLSAVDFVQADRLRRRFAQEMARIFSQVDLLLVPSLRDETLTISNFTGHPSITLRTGFVNVSEARSDWAPDPTHPLPTFTTPRRVPHGVTLIGRLFDEGTIIRVGTALEKVAWPGEASDVLTAGPGMGSEGGGS